MPGLRVQTLGSDSRSPGFSLWLLGVGGFLKVVQLIVYLFFFWGVGWVGGRYGLEFRA